jgi:hypothetical protein
MAHTLLFRGKSRMRDAELPQWPTSRPSTLWGTSKLPGCVLLKTSPGPPHTTTTTSSDGESPVGASLIP